jgi:tryptophan 2,3-dioxygenase
MTDTQKEIVSRIEDKYKAIDQNPDVHLEGLVWANPITYWDYILPDAITFTPSP